VNMPWLCLTVDRNETDLVAIEDTGSGIKLESCDGSLSQQWEPTARGHLKNFGNGMCLQLTNEERFDRRCRRDWVTDDSNFPDSVNHNDNSYGGGVMPLMFPCDDAGFDAQEAREPDGDWDEDYCNRD